MTFDDLIKSINWESVKGSITAIYGASSLDDYKRVYDVLSDPTSSPFPCKYRIRVDHYDATEKSDAYYEVSGIIKQGDQEDYDPSEAQPGDSKPDEEIKCGIEFTTWGEWLGMEIDRETVQNYGPSEIIAHCLWEMTFVGFDESTIQGQFGELKNQVKEIKEVGVEELERQGKLKRFSSVKDMMEDMGRDSSTERGS